MNTVSNGVTGSPQPVKKAAGLALASGGPGGPKGSARPLDADGDVGDMPAFGGSANGLGLGSGMPQSPPPPPSEAGSDGRNGTSPSAEPIPNEPDSGSLLQGGQPWGSVPARSEPPLERERANRPPLTSISMPRRCTAQDPFWVASSGSTAQHRGDPATTGRSSLAGVHLRCLGDVVDAADRDMELEVPEAELSTVHIETWEQRLDWRSFLSEAVASSRARQLFKAFDVEAEPPSYARPPPSSRIPVMDNACGGQASASGTSGRASSSGLGNPGINGQKHLGLVPVDDGIRCELSYISTGDGGTSAVSTTTESTSQSMSPEMGPEESVLDALKNGKGFHQVTGPTGKIVAGQRLDGPGSVGVQGTDVSVDIPPALFKSVGKDAVNVVVSVLTDQDVDWQGGTTEAAVHVNVVDAESGEVQVVHDLEEPIVLSLNANYSSNVACAYYDKDLEGDPPQPGWYTNGVSLDPRTEEGTTMYCKTNHLSLFAAILTGFIKTWKCSQLDLLTISAIKSIGDPDWYGFTGTIIYWSVLGLLAIVLIGSILLDLRSHRRREWSDEYFLISTKRIAELAPQEPQKPRATEFFAQPRTRVVAAFCCLASAVTYCCQCLRESSALRDALDDLISTYFEAFADIRDALERIWEGLFNVASEQGEGSRAFIFMNRMMSAMLVSTARHQVCAALHVTSDVVSFVMEDEDLHTVLKTRQGRLNSLSNTTVEQQSLQNANGYSWENPAAKGSVTFQDASPIASPSLPVLETPMRGKSGAVAPTDACPPTCFEMGYWDLDVPAEPDVMVPHKVEEPPLPITMTGNSSVADGVVLHPASRNCVKDIRKSFSLKQVSREEAWARLHEEVKDEIDRHFHRSSHVSAIPGIVIRLWWIHTPFGATFTHCVFNPSSLRGLFFVLDILGALLMGTIFFVASSPLGRKAKPVCGGSNGWAEQVGRLVAIGVASLIFASLPVGLLGTLHYRKFKKFDYEGSPAWQRQLKVWRTQDKAIWVVGVLYGGFSIFFVTVFLANATEKDTVSWALAAGVSLLLSIVAIPLALAVFIPLLTVALVYIVSHWGGHSRGTVVSQRHLDFQSSRIGQGIGKEDDFDRAHEDDELEDAKV